MFRVCCKLHNLSIERWKVNHGVHQEYFWEGDNEHPIQQPPQLLSNANIHHERQPHGRNPEGQGPRRTTITNRIILSTGL